MVSGYVFLVIPVIAGIAAGYALAGLGEEGEIAQLSASRLSEGGSPVLGDESAPITILEWGDYQCTFCFRFHQSTLEIIKRDYIDTGKARLVFKDFPLNGPDSELAAEATHCAGDQGMYWQYHDMIYENWAGERTGWITRDSLESFANLTGLDTAKFLGCLDSGVHRQKVTEMAEFGRDIGIDATPSFLIFDDKEMVRIRGNQPLDTFVQAIDRLGAADQG